MSKAFVKESDEGLPDAPELPEVRAPGAKNYISPAGFARLKAELKGLVEVERPEVVRTVSWAAKNGDRSENGDYLYGKKRLREIDRRVRTLIRRLEEAEVVNSAGRESDQVFFGASVMLRSGSGVERRLTLVGGDEIDAARGRVSWFSPIGRALLKARTGDIVTLRSPAGEEPLEILDVEYLTID